MTSHCEPNHVAALTRSFRSSSNSLASDNINSLVNFIWDNFTVDRSNIVTDVYKFYIGTTLAGTIELTYTDSNKTTLLSGKRV